MKFMCCIGVSIGVFLGAISILEWWEITWEDNTQYRIVIPDSKMTHLEKLSFSLSAINEDNY